MFDRLSEDSHLRWLGAVIFILSLAFLLRVYNLGAESVWIDEGYSVALAKHSISQIIQGTVADQHPPLYYLALHFWLQFVPGVFGARFLSVLVGVFYVAQIIHLGKSWGGTTVGLGAGLLLAISPMAVWYSREARMYMLLAVLTTAATFELWSCLLGKKRWTRYVLFTLTAMYTHYFAVFIIALHAFLVVIWAFVQRRLGVVRQWVKAMVICAVGFGVWLPIALMQMRLHTMPWISPPDLSSVRDTLLILIWGDQVVNLPEVIRWLALGALGLTIAQALFGMRRQRSHTQWGYGFSATWGLVPFGIIVLFSLKYPVFQTKQFLFLVGPFLLWLTIGAQALPRPSRAATYSLLLILAAISLFRQETTLTKDDWRGAAIFIRKGFTAGDVVYGNPAAAALPLGLYWDLPVEYAGYPPHYDIVTGGWNGEKITPEVAGSVLDAEAQRHTRLWLVESYPEFWDPALLIEKWLSGHARVIEDKQFRGIRVRLYDLR